MIPTLEASWIPYAALLVGGMTVIMLLRILGAVFSQALEHYELAMRARNLRNTHIARLYEIDRAIKRESAARAAANEQRASLMNAPPTSPGEEVGVDLLEAA